jgi:flagellar export protein FliJ
VSAFRFRLEKVQEWQRVQRELIESRIKQSLRALQHTDSAIAQVKAARVAADEELLTSGTIAGQLLSALSAYRARLRNQQRNLLQTRQQQEKQLEEQRGLWAEKERRCRLMDKLESRQREDFEYQAGRELENFASESYLGRWQARRLSSKRAEAER